MTPTRCSPVTMRKCLEVVEALKSAGMEFVPIPVLNDGDRQMLNAILASRLETLARAAEKGEAS
jgi:hypothetical protein